LLVFGGDTGAEVANPQADGPAAAVVGQGRAEDDRVPRAAVADRITGELHHGLGDALRVDTDDAFPDLVEPPVPVAQGTHFSVDVTGQLGERNVFHAEEVGALRLSKHEEVFHDAGHAVQFVGDQPHDFAALVRIVRHKFQVAAHGGDRGAEFVAGGGYEAPLGGERFL